MKSIITTVSIVILFFLLPAFKTTAGPGPEIPKISGTADKSVRISMLVERLEQIKSMDVSSLTRDERKTLRKEVRSIRKEMRILDEKVYLSVGAIIIILLLLILILK